MGIFGGFGGATDQRNEGSFNNAGADQVQAINAIGAVQTPTIEQMRVRLQGLVQQGILTPQMAETFIQQATAYNQEDPTARNALMGIVNAQGLDPQAKAALEQVQGQQGATERGNREAILQNAAARGIAGSGVELASQMGNEQNSATNAANQGFQAAADQNARRTQAIGGLATMDAQKAAAQDAINQFNTANRQSEENLNVGAQNQAQAQNLSEKQRIADTNAATANQQELYNKGLYQQNFSNELGRAQSLANANLGAASNNTANANTRVGATSADAGKFSDENLKTDIQEVDPKEMLDNLQGYSYKYKEGLNMDDGPQVGVMAQDVEKSAPQAVNDTPDGKTIDYSKMGGPIMAALASLNDRINKIEGEDGSEHQDG